MSKKFLLPILIILITIFSCESMIQSDSDFTKEKSTVEFQYQTTKNVEVNLVSEDSDGNKFANTFFQIYDESELISSGRTNNNGELDVDLLIPDYKNSLKIISNGAENNLDIDNGKIEFVSVKTSSSLSKATADTDGDGVEDANDAYPNDGTKAFNNYTPAKDIYGTLIFEDLWPAKGDYDFNDMVLGYNFNRITDGSDNVTYIELSLKVIAAGARYKNGFGFEIESLLSGEIQSVSGTQYTEGYIATNANGTESGQANAVIIPFDNIHAILGGEFINTSYDRGSYDVEPQFLNIVIELKSATNKSLVEIGLPPFNPFMIINGERTKEVHLADYNVTDLADLAGLSAPYFKDENNLPWALNFAENFVYPLEKSDIRQAFPDFEIWRDSDGLSSPDWYLSDNANVDELYDNDDEEQEPTEGTVTDIDGNVYKTVKIGNQWWMAENLKVTHFQNGDAIPYIAKDRDWKKYYRSAYSDNGNSNQTVYNWYAVTDQRKIAPEGWHIASDEEWKELELFLGVSDEQININDWRGVNEGTQLKSQNFWNGTDNYGFDARLTQHRDIKGKFITDEITTYFWTSSTYWGFYPYFRALSTDEHTILRNAADSKIYGLSVRCVKDAE